MKLSPDGYTKIYHPTTRIFCGVIWRDDEGRILAEDRDVDVTEHQTWQDAIAHLVAQTVVRDAA